MKNIIFASSLIIILLIIFMLQGCKTVESFRDPHLTVGCKVVEAQLKLGYFNQAGETVVCKLKCSKELPENFYYKYDNDRTGCHVEVGKPRQ